MEKYNGWTNYETWVVALWIDNGYQCWRERAEDYKQRPNADVNLAEELEESLSDHQFKDLYADLLNHALSRVNWREIALRLLED